MPLLNRTRSSTNRVAGLDLLRALAILWVMASHGAVFRLLSPANPIAHYGWMGVDLFFVLSGYLIGGQLMRPFAAGEPPRIGQFYLRRAFRILPAYLVVVALYFAWPAFSERPGLQPPWQYLTFTWNLFVDFFHYKAFSHVWSLCVEEHFYLLTPPLLLLMMRRPAAWKAITVCATILVGGMVLRGYFWLHDLAPTQQHMTIGGKSFDALFAERIYYPTWTQLDGLLDGFVLATLCVFRPRLWDALARRGDLVAAVGAASMALAFYVCDDDRAFLACVIGHPILAFGLACFVASAASPTTLLGRLRVPGASAIAAIAFSVYLVHKQVFHLLILALRPDLRAYPDIAFGLCAVAGLAVGALLYLCVERPFLRLRGRLLATSPPAAMPATP